MHSQTYQLTSKDGKNYLITPQGLTIGSDLANSVFIDDPSVGKYHARVMVAEGRCFVRVERGTGGVFVNGSRVMGQQEISFGDKIQISSSIFKLTVAEPIAYEPGPPIAPPVQDNPAGNYSRRKNSILISLVFIGVLLVAILAGLSMITAAGPLPDATPIFTLTSTSLAAALIPTYGLTPSNIPALTPEPTSTLVPNFDGKIICQNLDDPADKHACTITNLGSVEDTFVLDFNPSSPEKLNGFAIFVQLKDQEPVSPDEQGYITLDSLLPGDTRDIEIIMKCSTPRKGCIETTVTVKLYAANGTQVILQEGEVEIQNKTKPNPPKATPKPTKTPGDKKDQGDEGHGV